MKRGQVWLVSFDPTLGREQAGQRPALVVSVDDFNDSAADLVTVLPITSRARSLPTRIRIAPPEGGLRLESWVIGEQIRTVSKTRLRAYLGVVSSTTFGSVMDVVGMLLGFPWENSN